MNLETIYFIAEIISAIAVIASILYLAAQVRHSIAQNQAAARFEFLRAMGEVNLIITQDEKTASVLRRGLENMESLNEDELMQFTFILGQYANTWSVMYGLHQDDMLPEREWFCVQNDIHSVFSEEGGKAWWDNIGSKAYDNTFVEFVNSHLIEWEKSYQILKRGNED